MVGRVGLLTPIARARQESVWQQPVGLCVSLVLQSGGYAISSAIKDVQLPTLVVWGRNDEILRCAPLLTVG